MKNCDFKQTYPFDTCDFILCVLRSRLLRFAVSQAKHVRPSGSFGTEAQVSASLCLHRSL